jgi:aspartyl-tRNA(Asn)/glutamyl-tRNA(Gln) amidotransferase subunit A
MTTQALNIATLTIEDFARRLRARDLTAEQVTDSCLRRIEEDNPRLNAFILVMADTARQQAREADRELAAGRDRGPLHGVPISIKDLIDVAGTPTTAASRVREGHVAAHDAPVIAALRDAGAVIIGKTNLHEFAFGTTNEDSAFGPARNPHDVSRSPGGSSGGSAASVAAGMALATLGTDTGGSIRIPAAACGIVGLKPRHGELSTDGIVPLSHTLDHVGPLARTVTDAALVYRALRGGLQNPAIRLRARSALRRDLAEAGRRREAGSHVPGSAPVPVSGLRLAVPGGYFLELLDDEVRARFDEAIDRLRASGARTIDVNIRHGNLTPAIYLHLVLADAAAYHAATLERMPERYTPPVRLRLEMGRYVLAEDYARALEGREILRREVDSALAEHAALVLPTLPIPAPPLGAASVQVGSVTELVRNLMLRLTQLFNVTGHPAIALPAGYTSAGLPCSVQLVGADTETLLPVALACEAQITGVERPRSGGLGG